MEEKIKELRETGMSLRKIANTLNCTFAKVCYVIDPPKQDKRDENYARQKLARANNPLLVKCGEFRKPRKGVGLPPNAFFGHKDVTEKFGRYTKCYLTGDPIDLMINNYNFDHILPCALGGTGDLDNLGITTPDANFAKGSLTVQQFLTLCKKVLIHNGYTVEDPEK